MKKERKKKKNNKNKRKKILEEICILFTKKKMNEGAKEILNKNKNKRRKGCRNLEEKMNKSQRKRKKSDDSSAISKANLEFMKNFYQLDELFYCYTGCKYFGVLLYYIYEKQPILYLF